MNYSWQPQKPKKKNKLLPLAILLVVIFALFAILGKFINLSKGKSSLIGMFDFAKEWSFNYKSENVLGVDSNLENIIRKNIEGVEGEFAVVVEQLESSSSSKITASINAHETFPAGSLYKLFLMAAVLEKIEKGELKEDQKISAKKQHLDEVLGGEEFGYEDFKGETISYSISEALARIATISDNYAAIMLAEIVGWEEVRKVARDLGAKSTVIKAPISTTASDIALFFKQLYIKQVVSKTVSEKIIELLAKARINDRIPAKLPKDIRIIHKTGELARVRNDGGIIFLEGSPYLIVLLSKDLKGEDKGTEILADISQEVYEYFKSRLEE